MDQEDLELIADAFVEDRLREGDDTFLESCLKQQGVTDITELEYKSLSDKQREWMDDILERAQEIED